MNDIPEPAAKPETGGAKIASESTEEGSSPSTTPDGSTERPTLLERISGLFKNRNGSNLRDELADALAEAETDIEFFFARRAGDAPQYSPASRSQG